MSLRSTIGRAAGKIPRLTRLEFLDVPELGARYLNIPKTGSGSIRMQAYRQLCEIAGEQLDRSVLWDRTIWVPKHKVAGLPGRFTFAFSRDPYRRISAVYRHKVIQPVEMGKRVSPLFSIYGRRIRLGMPFDAFVRAVSAIPDHKAEKHFRSQSWFLFDGGRLLVEYLGRVERFDSDWAEVCARSGYEPITTAYNVSDQTVDVPWTEELRSLVAERYAEDFERLGYRP